MAQRVSQDAPLILAEGTPNARVSQVAPLALGEGTPNALVSQVACLVLVDAAAFTPQAIPASQPWWTRNLYQEESFAQPHARIRYAVISAVVPPGPNSFSARIVFRALLDDWDQWRPVRRQAGTPLSTLYAVTFVIC